MIGDLLVAMDAGVKFVAAFEPDRDDVAVGVVVRALGAFVDANAKASDV